jgi:hypothetical protein
MTSQVNHYTNDRVTETNGESSEEIRENIEQTRRRMGSRLDQIQERLDPRNLRDQTQEVVRNVVADSTDAMMEYVRDNTRELGQSLVGALKRHPLPAALIGLGLVWLVAENMGGSSDGEDEWSQRRMQDRYRSQSRSITMSGPRMTRIIGGNLRAARTLDNMDQDRMVLGSTRRAVGRVMAPAAGIAAATAARCREVRRAMSSAARMAVRSRTRP